MANVFWKKRETLLSYRDLRAKKTARQIAGKHLALILDQDSFTEIAPDLHSVNPIDFPDYEKTLESNSIRTNRKDACIAGMGTVNGIPVVCAELCKEFMMGSMGTAAGEKLTRSFEEAGRRKLPLIIFSASGGARMQEGMFSLMQMVKTSAAAKRYRDQGGLYISVLTNPTTGGVSASYASLGDIILAEPDALIGFAGPRVIEQTIGEKLPRGFQRSEFQLDHGFVDRIVKPEDMKDEITKILKLHGAGEAAGSVQDPENRESHGADDAAQPKQDSENQKLYGMDDTAQPVKDSEDQEPHGTDVAAQPVRDSGVVEYRESDRKQNFRREAAALAGSDKRSAYDHVMLARDRKRPKIMDFVNGLFEDFLELDGDRLGGEDKAILGGIALLEGRPVTVIGHRKGRTLQENLACNFGMPEPQGYRKAIRLMKQAEKFGRPIVTFVDTPGAYPGKEAEENGQSAAIAESLAEMSVLRVPVLVIVTGEGNSGGALAISVGDSVWMLENAVYSVLSPEGFASILWKDSGRMKEACSVMKMTAAELVEAGIADRVIREPEAGIQNDFGNFCAGLKKEMSAEIQRLSEIPADQLVEERYEKYRRFEGARAAVESFG